MTVIRPNSISGISSITAQGSTLEFFQNTGSTLSLLTDINGNADTATTATTATTAQGLTGTPNIVVGSVTGATASFSGNVSVGGTLTYDDVTNIDSVGLITARSGLKVTGGGADFVGPLTEAAVVSTTPLNTDGTVNIDAGLVHFRNANLGGTNNTLNIDSTVGVNTVMGVNDAMNVTLIHGVNASTAYVNALTIEGASQTVSWTGGAAPADGGSSGVDIYSFTIIKTASATYTVIGNQTRTS